MNNKFTGRLQVQQPYTYSVLKVIALTVRLSCVFPADGPRADDTLVINAGGNHLRFGVCICSVLKVRALIL